MSTTETISIHKQARQSIESGPSSPKNSWRDGEGIELRSIKSNNAEQTTSLELDLPPPSTAVDALESWNRPKRNIFALVGTYISFFVLGMNDATPGPLIPYLERYYDLTYTIVSLIFLSPFVGYTAAALLNNSIHEKFGQRGVAFIAGACHVIAYLTFSQHPPWPVMVVFCVCSGFGNGLADAGWCAWTGNMVSANKVQGFLQSFYSLGATISPLIATTMITKADLPWYYWYYVMLGVAVLEWVVCTAGFWNKTGAKYRAETHSTQAGSSTWAAIKNKVTIICAMFFLFYVGAEVSLGGWIVTFMLKERHASPYAAGISNTGFWLGMTVGRASLAFVTERFGERICVTIYLAIAIGLELIFWLVPKFVVSAVAVAFLGFFLGPIFPGGIVMCAKLLPKHLHVAALGSATAIAGVGGAGIPFAVGAIAQAAGVWVLQPIVLAVIAIITLLWLSLPRVKKRDI